MDAKRYRITVTIANTTVATDAGAWQMGMTWRKSLILDPYDDERLRDLRDRSAEQEPAGQDERDRRNAEAARIINDEWQRMRGQVLALVTLLNRPQPAIVDGTPLWARGYALSNSRCWQWELVAAHSTCVNLIMRAAGIDDWPPEDTMPDVTNPEITINLAILD